MFHSRSIQGALAPLALIATVASATATIGGAGWESRGAQPAQTMPGPTTVPPPVPTPPPTLPGPSAPPIPPQLPPIR